MADSTKSPYKILPGENEERSMGMETGDSTGKAANKSAEYPTAPEKARPPMPEANRQKYTQIPGSGPSKGQPEMGAKAPATKSAANPPAEEHQKDADNDEISAESGLASSGSSFLSDIAAVSAHDPSDD